MLGEVLGHGPWDAFFAFGEEKLFFLQIQVSKVN